VLFAGQGAQKPGMGKSLYDNVDASRKVFEAAEKVVPGIKELCFDAGQEELNKTVNTQPCVFVVDMAAYAAFENAGLKAGAGAGFSLGEYAALAASGVLPFENTLKLVIKRAEWMEHAAAEHAGGMAAVLGKSAEEVEKITGEVRTGGVLAAVNYNCPGQTVVAGDEEQLGKLLEFAKQNKIRCMRLPVGGAFHTERMSDAVENIYGAVAGMDFKEPSFVLYSNKTAEPYEKDGFKRTLADQTMFPVRFEQIIRNMTGQGFDTFVELGQGNTLTGFIKRIDKQLTALNISDNDSLVQAKAVLCGM